MTTSPASTTPTSAPRGPLRLRLDDSLEHGATDGVWWPRSRKLHEEVADLVDHFPSYAGHINRILFSRPDWDDAVVDGRGVRRIYAARGRPVKVGSFPSDDTRQVILAMASGQQLRLMALPSSTAQAEGERHLASAPDDRPLEQATTRSSGDWARWDNESPGD